MFAYISFQLHFMGHLIIFLFAALCFVAPVLFWQSGKVQVLTVYFWAFFGFTSMLHGYVLSFLRTSSTYDNSMTWIGPALVLVPFALMIYALERRSRSVFAASLMAFLGAFPVTILWAMSSALFIS